MIYSDKKSKSLGLFKSSWEAYLQCINACNIIVKSRDVYILATRDIQHEVSQCLKILNLEESSTLLNSINSLFDSRKIRHELHHREFMD